MNQNVFEGGRGVGSGGEKSAIFFAIFSQSKNDFGI